MMMIVTTATVYQAILVTFLLLLSKGWKIARQSIRRNDISNFTILMGAVYLCYSAFYVSLSIPAMYFFLNVSFDSIYYYSLCWLWSISCCLWWHFDRLLKLLILSVICLFWQEQMSMKSMSHVLTLKELSWKGIFWHSWSILRMKSGSTGFIPSSRRFSTGVVLNLMQTWMHNLA